MEAFAGFVTSVAATKGGPLTADHPHETSSTDGPGT